MILTGDGGGDVVVAGGLNWLTRDETKRLDGGAMLLVLGGDEKKEKEEEEEEEGEINMGGRR